MNHKRIYDSIINSARNRTIDDYTENHHIIPKSVGGSNKKDNIVKLTTREHFICHLLLSKIYGGKLIYAAWMMSVHCRGDRREKYTSKDYAWLKKKKVEQTKIDFLGHKVTQETKDKISKSLIGRMSGSDNPFFGKKHSEATLRNN